MHFAKKNALGPASQLAADEVDGFFLDDDFRAEFNGFMTSNGDRQRLTIALGEFSPYTRCVQASR
jgi:hypothetical protein